MITSTVVFGVIILFFLWRGYQKGFIHSITRILSWVVAYPAAIIFTRPLADVIFRHSSLDGLQVYFIAGGLVFLLASFMVAQLIKLFSKAIPEETLTGKPSRIGGAVIGMFVGGFLGLLVGYAINLVQIPVAATSSPPHQTPVAETEPQATAIPQAGVSEHAEAAVQPLAVLPVTDSFVDRSAKKLVGAVASQAIDMTVEDPVTSQLSKDFASNPQATIGHMKQLSTDNEVKAILADPQVQQLLGKGDIDELLDNAEFQKLINNEHIQAIFANAGGNASGEVAAETIVKGWARAEALKNDPRVAAILADPEFQKQLSSANHVALLVDPQFKELTEIVVSNDVQLAKQTMDTAKKTMDTESAAVDNAVTNDSPAEDSATTIYQWTDENGSVHFSDVPGNK